MIRMRAIPSQCRRGAWGSSLAMKGNGVQPLRWKRSDMKPANGRNKDALNDTTAANVPATIIADLADTNLEIDSLFDEIAQPVVQDKVDRQFVVLLQQGIKLAAEIKSERNRNAQADASHRFAATPPCPFLQRVR